MQINKKQIVLVLCLALMSGFITNGYTQVLDLPPLKNPNKQSVQSQPQQSKSVTLKGSVTTLDVAIEKERDTVNWYGWYLKAREYLSLTGGLQCPLGTGIIFHKDGTIEAQSFADPCLRSVALKRFPLPKKTSLSAGSTF